MKSNLLASAPSLDELKKSIARFYGGEEKMLEPVSDREWRVTRADGQWLLGVHVVKVRNRYRFEMVI